MITNQRHRRSIRLPQFDYGQPGVYFVTICTHQRVCALGSVLDGNMVLNDWGNIADRMWDKLPLRFPNVAIDARIVMPNHTHANIVIIAPPRGAAAYPDPRIGPPCEPTLGQIVAYYKYRTTTAVNRLRATPRACLWQRNCWEHVIRSEDEMLRIEEYILNNPARWSDDQLHPEAAPNAFNRA